MTAINLSISELSAELQFTRETVRKRLADAGIKSAGKRRNYPVFRLRDAVRALLSGPDADPNRLDPYRRKAFFQSQSAELRVAMERAEVIPRGDVEEVYGAALKPIRQMLETLPDILERDAALSPAQVARAERAIDEARETLHAKVLKAVKHVRARV